MPSEQLDTVLLAGAGVLLAAILAVRVSVGVGLPSLLVYLAIGVLLGESVIGIPFEDYDLASTLGFCALVLILAEGGLTTRWSQVRPAVGVGLALATLGVAVSVLFVAVTAHQLLDLRWQLAVLLGAVVSATDAAAVFSVLRRVPLEPSVSWARWRRSPGSTTHRSQSWSPWSPPAPHPPAARSPPCC